MGAVRRLDGGTGLRIGVRHMRGHAAQRKEAPAGPDMATLYGVGRLSGQGVGPHRNTIDSILSS